MLEWQATKRTLLLGFIVGLVFGSVNLVMTWTNPVAEDTVAAVFRFYGPMFFIWATVAFRAARRSKRLRSGVAAGLIVAFATFVAFDVLILLRVNLFLNALTARPDWQSMMARFRTSDFDSLRLFVNLDYLKGIPLKLTAALVVGAIMGLVGGFLGHMTHRRLLATA